MLLSVLDQSPIPEGSTPAQALHRTLDLAELADQLGYHRYWVAEHHATPALAFVIRHPAVTAAIIGPRTTQQLESQLGAPEIRLDDALLERIDEIVPPGTTLNRADAGWTNPALRPQARRR